MSETTAIEDALLSLGKAQVDALFARQEEGPLIGDSDFVPMLEAVLTVFETQGVSQKGSEELWEYAFVKYDRLCRDGDPSFTFEENRDLMRKYRVLSARVREFVVEAGLSSALPRFCGVMAWRADDGWDAWTWSIAVAGTSGGGCAAV